MNPLQFDLLASPPPPPPYPEGFAYRPDLISLAEESDLVARLRGLEFRPFEFQGHLGRRRVFSFGLHYDFDANSVHSAEPIPHFLLPVRERAAAFAGLAPDDLPHILVTEYAPGAGIDWHRDRPVFGDVIGVSLLSACRFRLRRRGQGGWERASATLEPRSSYVMRGPARTEWAHSIPASEQLRYSLTFRTLRAKR